MSGAVSHAEVSEALDRAYALALELGTAATAVADAIDAARALHLRAVGLSRDEQGRAGMSWPDTAAPRALTAPCDGRSAPVGGAGGTLLASW